MLEKLMEIKIDMSDVSVLYLKMEEPERTYLSPFLP